MKTDTIRNAGFWIRTVADLIDSILLDGMTMVLGLMGLGGYYWIGPVLGRSVDLGQDSLLQSMGSLRLQLVLVGIRIGLSLVYYPWVTYRFGTTLGKYPLRIEVLSFEHLTPVTWKQSILRCLGYGVSYLPWGCGFLMAVFHPQKRALHDLIAGTVSVIRSGPGLYSKR